MTDARPTLRAGFHDDALAWPMWIGNVWLALLSAVLLGYALFGKGFAYLGLPPLFIGEITLGIGMLALARAHGWRGILGAPQVWLLMILMIWGTLRTAPYVSRYGAEALRDAAIWGYSLFALAVFAVLITEPLRLKVLLARYRRFGDVFLVAIPLIWMGTRLVGDALPRWPWGDVPIVHAKGGDILLHTAGVLAFLATGWGGGGALRFVMLSATVLMVGAYNRGGLIAFLAAYIVCMVLRPQAKSLWRMAGAGLFALAVLAVTDAHFSLGEKSREVSFSQLVQNVLSVTGSGEVRSLEGTKEWRLHWWGDIVNYTVNGPYFWTGKGFGINLADDDGYQGTRWEGKLRSPHNGHMTMLARSGVPGFTLWVLVQLTWGAAIFARHYQAKLAGERQWAALFLFLFAYWVAFMANTSFDVFIEGPMGGIWFWTLYGVGLAALWIHRFHPETFADAGAPVQPAFIRP